MEPDAESNDPPRPETQEERALRALRAIAEGADLTAETMKLSNEFTDRHTGRIGAWFSRLFRRR